MSSQLRMPIIQRILAVFFLSAAAASLAIGRQDNPAASEKASVWWVDAETGKTLFTDLDIVRFDWERQLFELTRSRAIDLMSTPSGIERDLIVRDSEGEIYRGCYGSPSSASFWKPCSPFLITGLWPGAPRPPLYQIIESSRGEFYSGWTKLRFNQRLKERLQATGALRSIGADGQVAPIEAAFYGSYSEALKRRAAAILFPETVRLGRDIRLVLVLTEARMPGDHTSPPAPDKVEARVKLRSENGKSERLKTFAIPVENLSKGFTGTLPLAVWPWSESGPSVDSEFTPGPAELDISLVATFKASGGVRQTGEWKMLAIPLQILPGEQ